MKGNSRPDTLSVNTTDNVNNLNNSNNLNNLNNLKNKSYSDRKRQDKKTLENSAAKTIWQNQNRFIDDIFGKRIEISEILENIENAAYYTNTGGVLGILDEIIFMTCKYFSKDQYSDELFSEFYEKKIRDFETKNILNFNNCPKFFKSGLDDGDFLSIYDVFYKFQYVFEP